jgi:hypothetical protein
MQTVDRTYLIKVFVYFWSVLIDYLHQLVGKPNAHILDFIEMPLVSWEQCYHERPQRSYTGVQKYNV